MTAHPIIVVESDAALRPLQEILDAKPDPERAAANADFYAHDLPDFAGWTERVRRRVPGLYPAEVQLVSTQDELRACLPSAIALVTEALTVGPAELAVADRLKVVQQHGIVLRNIDTAACAARGIAVLTLRRRGNIAAAEHVLALMLALARKLTTIDGLITIERLTAAGYQPGFFDRRHTANANWARVHGLRGLHGATLGIIGLGQIGRELALRAAPFGMRVIYYQRTRLPEAVEREFQAEYRELDQLLAESDWVCPLVPGSPSTRNLLDRARLRQMKRGAGLVNISQANIVARDALVDALTSGQLGGFGLDAFYEEPGRADDPLLDFDNVIITPRVAAQPRFNGLDDLEELVVQLARAIAR